MQLTEIIREISSHSSPLSNFSSREIQLLVAAELNTTHAWVIAHPQVELTQAQIEIIREKAMLLAAGISLPYILGKWEFYKLDFFLNRSVLIPRPETELLVENAIAFLTTRPDHKNALDIGTGCGCIAISLAVNVPSLTMIASDVSMDALSMAKINASKNAVDMNVLFVQAHLYPPLQIKFDLICANLPYISTATLHSLPIYKKEPTFALDGGPDGLVFIRPFIKQASQFLNPQGMVLCEIEASQGKQVREIARTAFPQSKIVIQKDLSGHNRLLIIDTSINS